MTTDVLLEKLCATPQDGAERDLVARHSPVLLFDDREPLLPLCAGYTIFRSDGHSPSFPRTITLARDGKPRAAAVIEYAIWWDWDIGHLYELEHVWVYVDEHERLIGVEASAHGGFSAMDDGGIRTRDGRAAVLSEPGKHAFAPEPDWFDRIRKIDNPRLQQTGFLAGIGGVLVKDVYAGRINRTLLADRLVRSYLTTCAFEPSWRFEQAVTLGVERHVPWAALDAWIPDRVNWWIARLHDELAPRDYRYWRIGHRGAAAHAPDNSMAGLRKAAELMADMVEIDVRLSGDGEVVLSHDATIGGLPVARHTLDELRAAHDVVTLDEALDFCRSQALGAYIELKDGRCIGRVCDLLRTRRARRSMVSSFSADWIADFKTVAPDVTTSILFRSTALDPVALARACGAQYVHPCWERYDDPTHHLTREWIDRVREAGLGVVCWHEERRDVLAKLRELGVDGICSDAPELLT